MPWPLPLGGLTAKRSLLSLESLAAAIDCVLRAPAPLRRPLIVADDEPLSVAEMIAAMRDGLGRAPGLIPLPAALVRLACQATGRAELYARVAAPLVADAAALRALGFAPSTASRAGLAALLRQ
jgi:UDP-glucose 4-epimerase